MPREKQQEPWETFDMLRLQIRLSSQSFVFLRYLRRKKERKKHQGKKWRQVQGRKTCWRLQHCFDPHFPCWTYLLSNRAKYHKFNHVRSISFPGLRFPSFKSIISSRQIEVHFKKIRCSVFLSGTVLQSFGPLYKYVYHTVYMCIKQSAPSGKKVAYYSGRVHSDKRSCSGSTPNITTVERNET